MYETQNGRGFYHMDRHRLRREIQFGLALFVFSVLLNWFIYGSDLLQILLQPDPDPGRLLLWMFPIIGVVIAAIAIGLLVRGISRWIRLTAANRSEFFPDSRDGMFGESGPQRSESVGTRRFTGIKRISNGVITSVIGAFLLAFSFAFFSDLPDAVSINWIFPCLGIVAVVCGMFNLFRGIYNLSGRGPVSAPPVYSRQYTVMNSTGAPFYGQDRGAESDQANFCPWCGAAADRGRKYCRQCGGEL